MTLLLGLILIVLQPFLDYLTKRAEHRKQLVLPFLVAPRFTPQGLFDRVPRMAGLSCQLIDVLAIDPMGSPDVFLLIHLKQLLASGLEKNPTLTESALLRVVFP